MTRLSRRGRVLQRSYNVHLVHAAVVPAQPRPRSLRTTRYHVMLQAGGLPKPARAGVGARDCRSKDLRRDSSLVRPDGYLHLRRRRFSRSRIRLRLFIAPYRERCYHRLDMSQKSAIEWTDATWNPVTGCSKVSPGCKFCYAERFAERFRDVPGHPYEQGFDLKLWPDRLHLPLRWTGARMIFVNSMSDLFHEQIPDEFVERVFDTMARAESHTFQVLTKRSSRMADWTSSRYALTPVSRKRLWPRNVWAGVSVENELYASRIADLQRVPALTRFLSLEPLLGPVTLGDNRLQGIHWVIVGGESGCSARPMKPEWARAAREACAVVGVPFFFKQWGAHNSRGERVGKKAAGRRLDGRMWNQVPEPAI